MAEPAPTGRPKRTIKRVQKSNSISIKKGLKGDFGEKEETVSAIDQFQMHAKAEEEEPFTEEQLKEKWNAYLPRFNDRPSIKATLASLPKIQEEFSLLLEIDNRIQDEMLASIKPELVSWLRKELKNSKILLNTVVTEVKRDKVIYSDIEKYQELAKKNPNLALLKRTLNLDF